MQKTPNQAPQGPGRQHAAAVCTAAHVDAKAPMFALAGSNTGTEANRRQEAHPHDRL